jgi:hypothetical protein
MLGAGWYPVYSGSADFRAESRTLREQTIS